ncbi:MAG TPA: DUF2147 domain-containing protein [Burkholderiales bacterium]|nr:DUF2147 domain-containing protein [Burkholderiales bacterium]
MASAAAQSSTPVGTWKTVNERGEPEGLVRIVEVAGELRGRVEKVYSPPAPETNPVCIACSGERKDKPVIGMQILSGLRWDGEQYSGGEVLDPNNGRSYRCLLRVTDDGRKLEVRGYIGISLLGRTQVWLRD